jgi:hypothetical protein
MPPDADDPRGGSRSTQGRRRRRADIGAGAAITAAVK